MLRLLAVPALALCLGAAAPPPEVERVLPEPALSGEVSFRFATLRLYDAALWTAPPAFAWERPFALSLEYKRTISAERLADVSLREMARIADEPQPAFEPLREPLQACFADVETGDRITGYAAGADLAYFFYNGEERCELSWPGIRRSFFGIWLDDASRSTRKSRRLRGLTDG